ncbi:hypothetical protein SFB4_265G0, partial [Candidatus Arthromitus sp. SFB-4]
YMCYNTEITYIILFFIVHLKITYKLIKYTFINYKI